MQPVGVVKNAFGNGVKIERVDGEVAALRVIFERAIKVVAQNAATFVTGNGGVFFGFFIIGMVGAEGCYFDDFSPVLHMHQLKTAANDARITKLGAHLFGGGVGGHVEIFGCDAKQQITDAATDQIGLIARALEAFHHLDGMTANVLAANGMLAGADDLRRGMNRTHTAQGRAESLEQLFQHESKDTGQSKSGRRSQNAADSSTGRQRGERTAVRSISITPIQKGAEAPLNSDQIVFLFLPGFCCFC